MGCMGSKPAKADVSVADVYHPPPTSVSLFDISAVEEPWLIAKNKGGDEAEEEDETDDDDEEEEEEDEDETKKAIVPLPLLDKLEGFELAPASWSEVSKALEDMKPALEDMNKPPPPNPKKKKNKKKKKKKKKQQELKPATTAQPPEATQARSMEENETSTKEKAPPPELAGRRVVKDNPFLMRDRRENNPSPRWRRRDPFEGCPERRPPGAAGGGVVLYTTTLRGVRRTFEDCERARELVESCAEAAGVPAVDERDVSLHGEYLRELRELAGEGAPPPRLFVMGRYVGGAEECGRLAESGKLREMMRWAKARGEACSFSATKDGRGCLGCGGARFVPCWECGGSCKVVVHGDVDRCAKCNENGLMMCPICH